MRISILLVLFFGVNVLFGQSNHQHDHITGKIDNIEMPGVEKFDVVEFDNRFLMENSRVDENLVVDFPIGRENHAELTLWAYNMVHPEYSLRDESGSLIRPNDVVTLQGISADGGEVRLTVAANFTYGYIELDGETFWIEPAWYYSRDRELSGEIVIYKGSDVHPEHALGCAALEMGNKISDLENREDGNMESRVGQCYEVEIAIASDFSMYTKYNNSTAQVENHNVAVLNNVNGDYSGAFDDDIEFVVKTQFFSTCSTCDPWTTSTEASEVLTSFSLWGLGGGFQADFDLGELWTDRDFNGQTIGIAWVAALCENNRYHALQDWSNVAALLRVVTAHEIGHNFSAQHAPQSNFIMSPSVSVTDDWHPITLNEVSDYIALKANQGGCFSACASGNAPIPQIEALSQNICPGTTIKFFDRSIGDPTSWNWTFVGGNPATSSDEHPEVTYDIPGTYSVILETSNFAGSSTQTFNSYIQVGDPAESFPLYTDFDDGFGDWTLVNPDNGTTWELHSTEFAPGGSQCLRIDNFNYPTPGQRDAVVSPEFSLAGYQIANLHIEYAHARATSGSADSLIVYISDDGGQTFSRLFANADNAQGSFATTPPQGSAFDLTSLNEWCGMGSYGADCIDLDITNYVGQRDLIIRVENYTNSGNNTYLDRIYVSTNCFDLPPPAAAFTATPESGCTPLVVQFEDQSLNSPYEWNWTFENGTPASSSEQNPEVVFSVPGFHAVSLTVTNESGVDVQVETNYIEVRVQPVAAFDFDVQSDTVSFTSMSSGALGYLWDFGDGTESQDENPVHVYASDGEYEVTLQVINDCGMDEITQFVVIGTAPVAEATSGVSEGCLPLEVDFVSTSSANTQSLQWEFEGGTPATSIDPNPTITYNTPGVYDVVLIAFNQTGTDTFLLEDHVLVEGPPSGGFTFDHDGFLTVDFTYTGDAYESILWDFGDGTTSTEENPTHQYRDMFSGGWEIRQVVSNACGSDTIDQGLIFNEPIVAVTTPANRICAETQFQFEANSLNSNIDYQWTFEGGTPANSTDPAPVVTYDQNGVFDVVLIASFNGVSDTALFEDEVTVDALPEADFVDDMEELTNLSMNADSFEWYINGEFKSSQIDYTIDTTGMLEVMLVAFNECGADTMVQNLSFSSTQSQQVDQSDLIVYPNPGDGNFTLELPRQLSVYDIRILDSRGAEVMTMKERVESRLELALTGVSSGIYMLSVTSGDIKYYRRLVIVR